MRQGNDLTACDTGYLAMTDGYESTECHMGMCFYCTSVACQHNCHGGIAEFSGASRESEDHHEPPHTYQPRTEFETDSEAE